VRRHAEFLNRQNAAVDVCVLARGYVPLAIPSRILTESAPADHFSLPFSASLPSIEADSGLIHAVEEAKGVSRVGEGAFRSPRDGANASYRHWDIADFRRVGND
jgi:hypothetical protein